MCSMHTLSGQEAEQWLSHSTLVTADRGVVNIFLIQFLDWKSGWKKNKMNAFPCLLQLLARTGTRPTAPPKLQFPNDETLLLN